MENQLNKFASVISELNAATENKQKRPTLHKARINFIKSNDELFDAVVTAIKSGVSKATVVNILNSQGEELYGKPLKFEVRDITGVLTGVKGVKVKKRVNKSK